MRLKVKSHVTSSQEHIVLMCSYEDNGTPKKYIHSVAPGSVLEVSDEIGMALLGAPHLKGVLTLAKDPPKPEAKMVETAPQNKMAADSRSKKALDEL